MRTASVAPKQPQNACHTYSLPHSSALLSLRMRSRQHATHPSPTCSAPALPYTSASTFLSPSIAADAVAPTHTPPVPYLLYSSIAIHIHFHFAHSSRHRPTIGAMIANSPMARDESLPARARFSTPCRVLLVRFCSSVPACPPSRSLAHAYPAPCPAPIAFTPRPRPHYSQSKRCRLKQPLHMINRPSQHLLRALAVELGIDAVQLG